VDPLEIGVGPEFAATGIHFSLDDSPRPVERPDPYVPENEATVQRDAVDRQIELGEQSPDELRRCITLAVDYLDEGRRGVGVGRPLVGIEMEETPVVILDSIVWTAPHTLLEDVCVGVRIDRTGGVVFSLPRVRVELVPAPSLRPIAHRPFPRPAAAKAFGRGQSWSRDSI